MKAHLVSQTVSRVTRHNNPLHVFKYDLGADYSPDEVQAFVQGRFKFMKLKDNVITALNVRISNADNRWWFNGWRTPANQDTIPQYLKDSWNEWEFSEIRYIEIIVTKKPRGFVGNDDDKHDCLFQAILKAYNYEEGLLPKSIRKPWTFKRHLGVPRDYKQRRICRS